MGAKITVFGAISLKKAVGIMTLDGSIDGRCFPFSLNTF
jgi:hypothetical protein